MCRDCDNFRRNRAWHDLDAAGRAAVYLKEKTTRAARTGNDAMRDRQRKRASGIARRALKRGDIALPVKCKKCGRGDVSLDMHHPRCDDPIRIIGLCRRCHTLHHKSKGNGKRKMKSPFDKQDVKLFKLGGVLFHSRGMLNDDDYLCLHVMNLSGQHTAIYRNHHIHINGARKSHRIMRLHPTCRRQVELRERLDDEIVALKKKRTKGVIKMI